MADAEALESPARFLTKGWLWRHKENDNRIAEIEEVVRSPGRPAGVRFVDTVDGCRFECCYSLVDFLRAYRPCPDEEDRGLALIVAKLG